MTKEKKYKPCCRRRCLLGKCDTREKDACYCVCMLVDLIKHIESVINGNTLYDGTCFTYIPNEKYRQKTIDSWDLNKKQAYKEFRTIEAPRLLKELKEKLTDYEISWII